MKQDTAVQHLRHLLFLYQKIRANANDPILGIVDDTGSGGLAVTSEMLADLMPWIFDDARCPIPALVKILDRVDSDGVLAPMDYFNQMIILYKFNDIYVPFLAIMGVELPQEMPDFREYLSGWSDGSPATAGKGEG